MNNSDEILGSLAPIAATPPPMTKALAALYDSPDRVTPRRPARQLLFVYFASMGAGVALLAAASLRPDLAELPLAWKISVGFLWWAAFAVLAFLVIAPDSRTMLARADKGAAMTLFFVVALATLSSLWMPSVPGKSMTPPGTIATLGTYGGQCLGMGIACAIVPCVLMVFVLRRSVPVGHRKLGAAVGAGGGALGGLFLHLHCPIAESLHVGAAHVGVMVITAILGALLVPTAARLPR
jgi:hypothetical protein